MRFAFTFLSSLLCLQALIAQSRIQFERIGFESGLSHLSVQFVGQDSAGFMWFATTDGLSRYDGKRCKIFKPDPDDSASLLHHEVVRLGFDRTGRLCVNTLRGDLAYNPLTECFSPISPDEVNWFDLFPTPILDSSSQALWKVQDGKLHRVDTRTGSVKTYQHPFFQRPYLRFYNALIDDDARLWLATSLGLVIFDTRAETFDIYTHDPNNPATIPENSVRHVYKDREGNIWIATYGGGVAKAIRSKSPFQTFKHDPSNPNSLVAGLLFGICEDKQGNIWVASESYQIGCFHRIEGYFTTHESPIKPRRLEVPGYHPSLFLFCDSEGKIWANGACYNPFTNEWKKFLPEQRLCNVKGYVEIGDTVYALHDTTLYAVHRSTLRIVQMPMRFPPIKPDVASSARVLFRDRDGRVFVGTMNGFAEIDLRARTLKNWRQVDSAHVGTIHYGQVQCIYQTADRRYWVATRGHGLFVYSKDLVLLRAFTTSDGLPDDVIYMIAEDDDGMLWLTTNKGLAQFNPQTYKVERVFTTKDGLPNDEFNQYCFVKLRSGEFAGGGTGGFFIVDPKKLKEPAQKIAVALTDFKVFETSQKLDTAITFKQFIALDYAQNFLAFEFSALSFSNRARIQYAYKLEGINKDWIFTNDGVARYNSLAPGGYAFLVKARLENGEWGDARALRLYIAPPFWQTTWFRLLTAILVVLAVVGTTKAIIAAKVRREVEELKRKQAIDAERERISADMHDDIGATLTQITLDIERLKLQSDRITPDALDSLATEMRQAMMSLSEIVWSINPRNDNVRAFAAYLRYKANQMFEQNLMKLHLHFPDELPETKLSGATRHALFLATKEALHNVIKHSNASEISLSFQVESNALRIVVEDNGRGFKKAQESVEDNGTGFKKAQESVEDNGKGFKEAREFGVGLYSMQKRLREIGGTCTIRSESGKGTRVEFYAPLTVVAEKRPLTLIEKVIALLASSLRWLSGSKSATR